MGDVLPRFPLPSSWSPSPSAVGKQRVRSIIKRRDQRQRLRHHLSSHVDQLTVQLVDRPIGRRLIGAIDEGVAAALHQDRRARQAVLLEELPEGALVAI